MDDRKLIFVSIKVFVLAVAENDISPLSKIPRIFPILPVQRFVDSRESLNDVTFVVSLPL